MEAAIQDQSSKLEDATKMLKDLLKGAKKNYEDEKDMLGDMSFAEYLRQNSPNVLAASSARDGAAAQLSALLSQTGPDKKQEVEKLHKDGIRWSVTLGTPHPGYEPYEI